MSAPYVDFKINGLQELERELQQLPSKLAGKALRKGAQAGARQCRDRARMKARQLGLKSSGALIKSIKTKVKRTGNRDLAIVGVGYRGRGWYGRLYEYGFKAPSGDRTQRPAIRSTFDEASKEIATYVSDAIWKELKKIQAGGIARPHNR